MADFKVRFNEQPNFKANMGEVQVVTVGAPPYDGAYEVTPNFKVQTMETKEKIMRHNVEIRPIPICRVGNNFGGNTIIIGE